jgi:hypothetical protein
MTDRAETNAATAPVTRQRRNHRRLLGGVAVVVVVAGFVATLIGYRNAHQPKGTAPTGLVPAPACQLSPSTLAQTHTHNPTYSDESQSGDQAAYQTAVQRDGTTTVALTVRKATTVVEVTYEGADEGILWTTPMPFAQGEELTKLVANELLH